VRPVRCPDLDDPTWTVWRDEARKAIATLEEHYGHGAIEIREELYKHAMPFLLRIFEGKCAYCESLITNTQPGDVEHYRPKGRIKEMNGTIVKIKGSQTEHPGYWWLCYEWSNLLPSCIDCNRRRFQGDDGQAAGKADLFPIAGTRAEKPSDPLSMEQALLLNPTEERFNPADHFDFLQDGKVAPKTPRATTSCELLGLNLREKLVGQRADAYANASDAISKFVVVSMSALTLNLPTLTEEEKKLRHRINDMWEGRTPHTAFARLALTSAKQMLAARNIQIALPLPTG
jgi:hypothetical protein